MAYTTIDDPSAHFQVTLYTGNDTDGTQITNSGNSDLQPDWLWIRNRTDSGNPPAPGGIWDSTRGFAENKVLTTFTTNGEGANSNGFAVATSDGFTVEDGTSGSNPRTATNKNSKNYVAYQWKANGGTTSSNSDGSITTTVQANQTAGFSIVTYTSAAGGQTIGHGLGAVPELYIIKERSTNGDDWFVYSKHIGAGKKLRLSGANAAESDTNIWQNTTPTNQIAYLQNDGGGVNQNSGGNQNYVAYFFTPIKGYSRFGMYRGNGGTDGTFVYTGFKPAYLLTRCTSANTDGWAVFDHKKDVDNPLEFYEFVNNNSGEGSGTDRVDFLSNGFKWRQGGSSWNGDGQDFIYLAFAENPYVTSGGVPTTAR